MTDDMMFMRGHALGELVLSPHERLLTIELGYSREPRGPYQKLTLMLKPEGAAILAKELGELAGELGSTHH